MTSARARVKWAEALILYGSATAIFSFNCKNLQLTSRIAPNCEFVTAK